MEPPNLTLSIHLPPTQWHFQQLNNEAGTVSEPLEEQHCYYRALHADACAVCKMFSLLSFGSVLMFVGRRGKSIICANYKWLLHLLVDHCREADKSHARFDRRLDRISQWHHHSVLESLVFIQRKKKLKQPFNQSALSFLLSAFCSVLFHNVCSVHFITAFAPAMHQQQYRRCCFLYFYTLLIDGAWIVLELPSQDWLHGSTEPPADRVRRILRPLCLPT